jgi:plastocyanin
MRTFSRLCAVAALVTGVVLAVPALASATPAEIYADDACGPSFNAVIGPGTCVTPGGTPFGVFAQQLSQNGFAGAWHFSAPQVRLHAGDSLTVENRGGETHTLTPVTQFGGGGIVAPINQLIFGTPTPPIFFNPAAPLNFIPAGGEFHTGALSAGTHLYICVIHPWMRETVTVG